MLKAILVDCIPLEMSREESEYRLKEAESLIKTYGGVVLLKSIQKKVKPVYSTYLGSGRLEELKLEGQKLGANIIIINNELKAMQSYNIGELLRKSGLQIWDRIDLILKIFQKHAETKEAKMEIQLASIKHMGPRIFGMGMELSRQGGGIGGRGIGETNTEIMKRHLAEQTKRIEKDLEKCAQNRHLHRQGRLRKNLKTVGIIGYTNAGKSSLLNALTNKGALAEDKLFATLDTRVGHVYLPDLKKEVLLTDTIGFIQDLPHSLIKSFHSTLEETIYADLILHVIDLSDPRWEKKIAVVNGVLMSLHATDKPIIYVFNKMDAAPKSVKKSLIKKAYARFSPNFVSAQTGEGLDKLKKTISQFVQNQ